MSTAFVLCGGGNLGAVQVGMLHALFAAGIHPDVIVGTSVGAFNGAWGAGRGPEADIDELAAVWRGLRRSACASALDSNTLPFKNSRRSVLCHRSTMPVVVGDRGAVRMCLIPFSRQIRSNNTSPVPGPNRPVKTLPLSVRI